MINYSYLQPPRRVIQSRLTLDAISGLTNGKPVRYIFQNVSYEQFEKQAITKLNDYLKLKEPNIHYSDELLLRFSYLADFRHSETLQNIRIYEQWHHNETITSTTKSGRNILEDGIIYSFGRDYQYSPVIYVLPSRIDFKKYELIDYLNALCALLHPIEQHMLVGGIVEKWVVVIDCQGKKSTLSLDLLKKYFNLILHAYPYRLKHLFVVNYSSNYEKILNVLQQTLQQSQSQAMPQIVQPTDLTKYIGLQEREEKYGGTHSNLCEYWPIHSTNKCEEENTIVYEDESDTEYQSVMNDNGYFQKQKVPVCDWTNKCTIF